MINHLPLKSAAVALLATTAACSCIDAPDLDVAPVAVERKFEDTGYQTAVPHDEIKVNKVTSAVAMPLDRVYFDLDSAVITPRAGAALKDVARYIKAKDISNMIVEGHADERGTREYNLALGDRRAVSIKRYLNSLGVDSRGVKTISYGKERPAEMGSNENAWAKNRRGVIVFK